ncbi:hypothetical protein LCGC14_1485400 [marine sediment metagenome]|uniref:Uncharacterized protein n=1 Tax=marine sediment metagenome TaxID=412755 RepID=A0A0F9LNV8_9ZZZZ
MQLQTQLNYILFLLILIISYISNYLIKIIIKDLYKKSILLIFLVSTKGHFSLTSPTLTRKILVILYENENSEKLFALKDATAILIPC